MALSFCPIGPISTLHSHVAQFQTHMALAHLVEKYPEYRNFYREASERGNTVLMDNGAFENGVPFEGNRLYTAAKSVGATVVVAPDFPGKPSKLTIDGFNRHEAALHDRGFKVMFCPQSTIGNFKEWFETLDWGLRNPNVDLVGYSILAIPNAFPTVEKHRSRAQACLYVKKTYGDRPPAYVNSKPVHMLGMLGGLGEIREIIQANQGLLRFVSFDSSSPIWQGIRGRQYDDDGNIVKDTTPVDFTYQIQPKDFAPVQRNLKMFEQFKGKLII